MTWLRPADARRELRHPLADHRPWRTTTSLDVAWLDYAGGKSAPWAVKTPAIHQRHPHRRGARDGDDDRDGRQLVQAARLHKDADGAFFVAYNKDIPTRSRPRPAEIKQHQRQRAARREAVAAAPSRGTSSSSAIRTTARTARWAIPAAPRAASWAYDPTNKKARALRRALDDVDAHAAPGGLLPPIHPDTGAIVAPPAATSSTSAPGGGTRTTSTSACSSTAATTTCSRTATPSPAARPRQVDAEELHGEERHRLQRVVLGGHRQRGRQQHRTRRPASSPASADGRFVIVHTTSQGRGARDVRLVLADGTTGKADPASAVWLTTNQGTVTRPCPRSRCWRQRPRHPRALGQQQEAPARLVRGAARPDAEGRRGPEGRDGRRVRRLGAAVPLQGRRQRGQRRLGLRQRDAHSRFTSPASATDGAAATRCGEPPERRGFAS